MRRRYRKKIQRPVTAVQLDLDCDDFTYTKWGGEQLCKKGDWLVNNGGDTYTVDGNVFARTYKALSPGVYVKSAPIWAEVATEAGTVETLEGRSDYKPGDFLVSNNEDGSDAYCISAERFRDLYKLETEPTESRAPGSVERREPT